MVKTRGVFYLLAMGVTIGLLGNGSASRKMSIEKSVRYDRLDERLSSSHQARLSRALDHYMDVIAKSWAESDDETHQRATLALLQYASRIPIYFLSSYQERLFDHIDREGILPHLSFYIDYGQRLSGLGTRSGRKHYRQLVDRYQAIEIERSHRPVFLRAPTTAYFALTSENVAVAVGYMLFSDVGVAMSAGTQSNVIDYLHLLSLIESCEDKESTETADTLLSVARDRRLARGEFHTCDLLFERLRERLGERDPSKLAGLQAAIDDVSRNGFRWGGAACVQSLLENDPMAEMVRRLEEYVDCKTRQLSPDWDFGPDWFAGGGTALQYRDVTVVEFADTRYRKCDTAGQCYHAGDFVAEYEYTEGGKGWEEQHYDGQGGFYRWESESANVGGEAFTWLRTESYDPSTDELRNTESVTIAGNVAILKETITKGGVSTTTVTKSVFFDGKWWTWTETYDDDGNLIGETQPTEVEDPPTGADSTATDTFEPPADPCARILHDNPRELDTEASRIETQIIPAIDSPFQLSDDPCLNLGGSPVQRCVSVWLCDGGEVDADCRCKINVGAVPNVPSAYDCQLITCDDGYRCDPATGTCVSEGAGAAVFQPGTGGSPFPMPFSDPIAHSRLNTELWIERMQSEARDFQKPR